MVKAKMVSIVCVCVCLSRCCRGCVWIAKKNSRYTICFFCYFRLQVNTVWLSSYWMNEDRDTATTTTVTATAKLKIETRRCLYTIRDDTNESTTTICVKSKRMNSWDYFYKYIIGLCRCAFDVCRSSNSFVCGYRFVVVVVFICCWLFFVCVLFLVRRCIITRCFYFHSRDIIHVHRMKNLIINMCVSIYYYYYLFIFFFIFPSFRRCDCDTALRNRLCGNGTHAHTHTQSELNQTLQSEICDRR